MLRAGLTVGAALNVVLAADTLSILTMEVVDNLVMAAVPGAMSAGLVNPVFWAGMGLALAVAFAAAFPVNRYLLSRGKGHALVHEYHHAAASPTVERRCWWWAPQSDRLPKQLRPRIVGTLRHASLRGQVQVNPGDVDIQQVATDREGDRARLEYLPDPGDVRVQ